ncbi:hypothetical protein FRB99_008155 [Tulasnella sp. 403]|nr:hypothetical protein FRB99_008155 [Tulasnella sp. 403]
MLLNVLTLFAVSALATPLPGNEDVSDPRAPWPARLDPALKKLYMPEPDPDNIGFLAGVVSTGDITGFTKEEVNTAHRELSNYYWGMKGMAESGRTQRQRDWAARHVAAFEGSVPDGLPPPPVPPRGVKPFDPERDQYP